MDLNNLSLKAKIILANTCILLFLFILAATSYVGMKDLRYANNWVDHTHKVIRKARQIESAAVDMETGMRGFLLAGKEDFLNPYNAGMERFKSSIHDLKKTVSDNPAQVRRLGEIEANIRSWIADVTEPSIKLRRDIGDNVTMNDMAREVGKAEGRRYFDKFRAQIKMFIDTEAQLLLSRSAKLDGETDIKKMRGDIDWVIHTKEAIEEAMKIQASAIDMETGMRGFLLSGKDEFMEPYNSGSEHFSTLVAKLQAKVSDNPAQVALLTQIKQTIDEWQRSVVSNMLNLRKKIGDSKTMDDMADLVGEARGKKYFDKFRGQIVEFINIEKTLMEERQKNSENSYSNSLVLIVVTLLLSVLISIFLSFLLANSITNPFQMIFAGLTTFSKNELIQLKDRFNEVVVKLTKNSSSVANASQSIATSSSSLSSNTSEQAAAVEETSSSVEEMNGILQNNMTLAQKSFELANEARSNVGELTESFEKIEESNHEIESLVKVIQEVGEKTKVIDEIVFQTKLLSFNASVEAERAGEHGRGFAVVAQEVGNLAALSGKAAVEISSIVKDSTERGASIAKENSDRVQKSSEAMKKTSDLIESVSVSSQKIVDASKEQAKGVDQINQAIQEINSATQNSASIASDASRSSGDLNSQAAALNGLVEELNFYLYGNSTDIPTGQPTIGASVVQISDQKTSIATPIANQTQNVAVGQNLSTHSPKQVDSWEDL